MGCWPSGPPEKIANSSNACAMEGSIPRWSASAAVCRRAVPATRSFWVTNLPGGNFRRRIDGTEILRSGPDERLIGNRYRKLDLAVVSAAASETTRYSYDL